MCLINNYYNIKKNKDFNQRIINVNKHNNFILLSLSIFRFDKNRLNRYKRHYHNPVC